MKTINYFLEKFNKIKVPNESIRKEFKSIVLNKFNFEISFKSIKIQNNIIYFNAPSVIKQEVYLNKKNILAILNKKFNRSFENII